MQEKNLIKNRWYRVCWLISGCFPILHACLYAKFLDVHVTFFSCFVVRKKNPMLYTLFFLERRDRREERHIGSDWYKGTSFFLSRKEEKAEKHKHQESNVF